MRSAVNNCAEANRTAPAPSIAAVIATRSPSTTPPTVARRTAAPWFNDRVTTSRMVGPGMASTIADATTKAR